MEKKLNLTEGNILTTLVKLSMPIIGTSFIQMAYNLTDMLYLGRLSSKAVAAVGTAGFFTWFANSIIFLSKAGAEIGVAQSIGRGDTKRAKKYIKNTVKLNIIMGFVYALILIIFRKSLIGFFNLGENSIVKMAEDYLLIAALGLNFFFINPICTSIFNGYGDSKTPFKTNIIGLLVNIVLNPVLIFGFGPIPKLGVAGAAIATVFAQFVVSFCFIYTIVKKTDLLKDVNLLEKFDIDCVKSVFRYGMPVALQNGLFCIFAMIIARIVSDFGDASIAVQKVGSQIEAISWMTAGGFSTALSAYVGQNYGAKKWDRIYEGYYKALLAASILGIGTTLLLYFGSKPLFALFIPEKHVIPLGVDYLKILSYSQLFMCIEITTAGAFNGLGKTVPPSLIGIIFTALRIPAALILSSEKLLGLNGVWWSISLSSVLKGIILTSWFVIYLNRKYKKVRIKENLPVPNGY
ncbi:MATE family efflux transporter [Clostridium sp. MSJ-11]|uniref:Probable multidrug resistance protein NorM n=1 Tax=Clostridium mobile TaxID=2841512 RepID=A0ABS6EL18_9CLOT|nr:MATE family efflux transporter [Clostridium mobile]MBU5485901.1 MATE family efflux transporter [Clostridium mobile]